MKGFIFDLDGTLLDSLGLWLDIDKKYMAKHGIEYQRSYSDDIKKLTFDECAVYFRDVLGVHKPLHEIKQDWQDMSYEAYQNELLLKPYAYEFVKQCARQGKCIIATSCHKESAYAALKHHHLLDYIEEIVTTSEVGFNKENPHIYELCAEKLGCKIQDCLVFEDVIGAAISATKAGFKVIGVYDEMWANDFEQLKKTCTQTIHSFKELLNEM